MSKILQVILPYKILKNTFTFKIEFATCKAHFSAKASDSSSLDLEVYILASSIIFN